ncbi:MAG: polysaccharide deacetylase family protein [Thermoanaerobaculia bacterium]
MIREAAKRLLYSPPLRALGGRVRPRAVVLLYHRVAEAASDPHGLAVSPAAFESHLDLLRRRFHVMPLPELIGGLPRRAYRDCTVAVTFDDGYADNLTTAVPIAARLGVPVTVFVTAGPVLDGGPFPWDRGDATAGRPLNAYELRRLASVPGVSIGGHTVTHPRLADLPAAGQEWELTAGRQRLEEITGRPVDLLAYPFGKPDDVAPATPRLAERAGYRAAFLSQAGRIVPSSPRYALPRLSVHDWPAEMLARKLEEIFDPR